MINFVIRRVIYAVLVLFGVNLVTFFLFFSVNTPEDMARLQLGGRHVTQQAIERWEAARGYDKPLYFNAGAQGVGKLTDTVLFNTSSDFLRLDMGHTNDGRDIRHELAVRFGPTAAVAVPVFIIAIGVSIVLGLGMVMFRQTALDTVAVIALVGLMSISSLFFVIVGQYIFASLMRITPLSGYAPPPDMVRFLVLPVIIAVLSLLGPNTRLYRAIFLEELGRDYVRTARAKGVSELTVLFRHVLRNSLIPIITAAGLLLPALFAGSVLLETFFGIPGLGLFTIDGIRNQDFSIVRAMVFVGSFLYVFAYLLTDLAYAWSDPRVRMQ
jgi:peptide/nickel transport system permease protein